MDPGVRFFSMLESTLYHKGIIKGKNIYSRLDVSQLMLIIPKDVCDAIFPSSFISKLAQKTTIWNQDNFKKYILLFAPCTIMKSVCYKKTARCKLEDTDVAARYCSKETLWKASLQTFFEAKWLLCPWSSCPWLSVQP